MVIDLTNKILLLNLRKYMILYKDCLFCLGEMLGNLARFHFGSNEGLLVGNDLVLSFPRKIILFEG
jgi:hypothetical protein